MNEHCIDCSAPIELPLDSLEGEIVGCPDCGLDYVVTFGDQGNKHLKQLSVDGEDWGE